MIAIGEKLSSSVCKICRCSSKAALLQVSACEIPLHSKLSCIAIYKNNALLVPVRWREGLPKLLCKSVVSCKAPHGAGESRYRIIKPAFSSQQREKNVLVQPLDLEAKIPQNRHYHASVKKSGGSQVDKYEGPVLHHSAAAALVATNQQNEQHMEKESQWDKAAASQENPVISEKSSEELLSCTTAYIRRISTRDEWDFDLQSSKDPSPDIEYVVEQNPAFTRKPLVKLSGAILPSARDWRSMEWQWADLPAIYATLTKSRLTGLVVATALGGYVLAPTPLSMTTLVGAVAGTALVSAAANTTNQVLEVPYDAQMNRTANRALVRGVVSPLHAAGFASTCGVGGLALLLGLCGPTAAGLGLLNLGLYTAVYTPLKRRTIANTWVGALVGAIPPLIGWCGCGGPLIGADAWGAWLMAGLLFAWQFPHFNALSWNLRADYSKAGYRMMCVTNPRLCRVTCLRYSVALLMLGFAAPALSVTTWTFAVDSAPLNGYMLYLSYRFYKDGDSRSARNLFRFSLFHLPTVMVLLLISKKWQVSAAGDPPLYTSSVVYNKNFTAQTVPTIVAAATQTEIPSTENDSKTPDVLRPNSLNESHEIEEKVTRRFGESVSLATELEQGVVSSMPSKNSANSYEVPKTVKENGSLTSDTQENNGKTSFDLLAKQVSR
ncbi:Protohem IX farnesyltransferase [Trinorchestia longiramus]|nr:Protohem IX farnesyltransferase [Trinorchestia longiramus]